jgi:hypothetical protein
MRKTLYTLNIDNYAPKICEITYPLLKKYAHRCRAEFVVIEDRKFPDYPVCYEKLQIHELAEERHDEWSIYLDSDALVHPESPDFTCFLGKDTVFHNGVDPAALRWRYDHFFMRDGRNIGSCDWFTIASEWCRDLWHPLDISLDEALSNIRPTVIEANSGVIDAAHLLDDYVLSRNIARFGLKVVTATSIYEKLGIKEPWFFWHRYDVPLKTKIVDMEKIRDDWKLPK